MNIDDWWMIKNFPEEYARIEMWVTRKRLKLGYFALVKMISEFIPSELLKPRFENIDVGLNYNSNTFSICIDTLPPTNKNADTSFKSFFCDSFDLTESTTLEDIVDEANQINLKDYLKTTSLFSRGI